MWEFLIPAWFNFSSKGDDGSTQNALLGLIFGTFYFLFDSKVFYTNALMMIDIIKETFHKNVITLTHFSQ